MSGTRRLKFDEIGYWSEIKLDIVKDYASAYSRILAAQRKQPLHYVYIDAFAGSGVHISKATGEYVPGSPVNGFWCNRHSVNITLSIQIDKRWRYCEN